MVASMREAQGVMWVLDYLLFARSLLFCEVGLYSKVGRITVMTRVAPWNPSCHLVKVEEFVAEVVLSQQPPLRLHPAM